MRLLHIGRATTNDIVVADTTVSRQHAQLMIDDIGQATLIDLGSSNGTFVNGRRISAPTRLDATDIVKVGEYLLPWRQYIQASPQTSNAYPPPPAAQSYPSQPPANPGQQTAPNRKMLWYALGGVGAVAVIVVIALLLFGGGSKPDFEGKWHDIEEADAWIEFKKDGKYTEGFKDAIIYDDATWKAMGIDRLLIEKGEISVSKKYKFEGKHLKITYGPKTTVYERE